MWNFILSCFRVFVLGPVVFVMAVVGILICIVTDLLSLIFKQFKAT